MRAGRLLLLLFVNRRMTLHAMAARYLGLFQLAYLGAVSQPKIWFCPFLLGSRFALFCWLREAQRLIYESIILGFVFLYDFDSHASFPDGCHRKRRKCSRYAMSITRANATFAKIHDSYVVYAKVATVSKQVRTEFKGCFAVDSACPSSDLRH